MEDSAFSGIALILSIIIPSVLVFICIQLIHKLNRILP